MKHTEYFASATESCIGFAILVAVYYLPGKGAITPLPFIFALAAITDWLDGYLARKLDQSTAFAPFFLIQWRNKT